MKIGEKIKYDHVDDKLIVQKTYDYSSTLRDVAEMKKQGLGQTGESRLVGRIPTSIINEWIKEAGLKWTDTDAVKDVIRRKMLSGEFSRFRVWDGSY